MKLGTSLVIAAVVGWSMWLWYEEVFVLQPSNDPEVAIVGYDKERCIVTIKNRSKSARVCDAKINDEPARVELLAGEKVRRRAAYCNGRGSSVDIKCHAP